MRVCLPAQAEPSFSSQLWRTVRTIAGVFILVTCLGTLLDDKGLMSKGFMNNPDLKPQFSSNTKFADVKGVDEAKHELEEVRGEGRGGGWGSQSDVWGEARQGRAWTGPSTRWRR